MVVIRGLIVAAVSVAVSAPIGSDQELRNALVAARDAVIEMAVQDHDWNGAISLKVRELVDLLFVVDDRSSIAYLQRHLPQTYADGIRHVLEAASTPADFAARIAALDSSTELHDRDQALELIARQQSERSLLGDALTTAMRIAQPEQRFYALQKIAVDCYRQNRNVEAERATSAIIDLALEPRTVPDYRLLSMAQVLGGFASSLRQAGKVDAARNVLAQMRFFVLSSDTPRLADLEAFGHESYRCCCVSARRGRGAELGTRCHRAVRSRGRAVRPVLRRGVCTDRCRLRTGRRRRSVPGALLEARPGPVAAAGGPPCVIRLSLDSSFKEYT